jgi:hypothetical protein
MKIKDQNIEGERTHSPKRDQRFQQLIALARDDNEEAAADLFREYGVSVEIGGNTP